MRKIILVSEKQLFEGLIAGIFVAFFSILHLKIGFSVKVFEKIDFDLTEFMVFLALVISWIIIWSFRKTSNVIYDEYLDSANRRKIEISYYKKN